jgi:hypothetical protein
MLAVAFADQLLHHDRPCSLCLLQRAGFVLAGFGLAAAEAEPTAISIEDREAIVERVERLGAEIGRLNAGRPATSNP